MSAAAALIPPLAAAALLVAVTPPATPGPATQLALQAAAATPDPAHGRILFLKHCAECHGPHGWGDGVREIPAIAGQHQRYLLTQLARFSSGEREGSAMHGSAMHDALQPADVGWPQAFADLTAYLAQAPPDPHPEHSDGQALKAGQRTYARACAGCHGSDGTGSDAAAMPAIGGQHYSYLLAQLKSFAAGRRPHPPLADSGAALSAQQQQSLADYLSRLTSGP